VPSLHACRSTLEDPQSLISHLEVFNFTAANLRRASADCALIVNCTPLGMTPRVEASPWLDDVPFPPGAFVYDMVYNPAATRLTQQAKTAGLRAATGLGMLVEQGALAFELWTGRPAPRALMRGTELEFVIMVIAVSCVKLLSAHNSTQHTSRKHKV
jgi:Shikimate 5-dehydrogenase